MPERSVERLRRVLAGDVVTPCVEGLAFVPPGALPGPRGDVAASPPAALARTCEEARLDFAFVPSWEPWADAAVIELAARGVAALWVVRGVLWPALEERGVASGLAATVTDPGSLASAMDAALLEARDALARGLGWRVAGVVVAEDLGGSGGTIAAPAFLAREVLPRLALLVSPARRAGLPALLHSDGDVRAIVPSLKRRGFLGLHGDCGGADGIERMLAATRSARVALVGAVPASALADPMRAAAAGGLAGVRAAAGGLAVADDGGVTTASEFAALLGALAAARGE